MNSRLLIPVIAGLLSVGNAFCQNDPPGRWENVLEMLLSDEDLSQEARDEMSDIYESMHDSPLNINTATKEELAMLPFLDYGQIEDIHAYIYMHGPMLTLGELQLTGSLDFRTRQLLRYFVYAGEIPSERERLKIGDVLKYGRSELVTRMDIPLYYRDGFRYHSPDELKRYPNRAYLGNRLSNSVRYSFNWHNRIRLGLTADKDAGEPFPGRNSTGYDFWSPYLYIKDMGRLRELALGRFKAQFGYGLLMGSGFSTGKSMALSSVARNNQGIKPHSSTQEYGYLCGAGAAVGWGHTTLTLLGASTPSDATIKGDSVISSFKEDGYHRTELEWSKKHNVSIITFGANLRYSFRGLNYGCTVLTERLSLPYKLTDTYNGLSADCSIHRPRYALAAELSVLNRKHALLISQTFRLSGGWVLNSLFRSYSPGYTAIHSNGIAEGSVQNETGLLNGFSYSRRNLKINGYLDLFRHPKPRYGVSTPSNGMDIRLETDWRVGSRDNLFLTGRFKSKQKDCKYTGQPEYCITGRYRLRWTHGFRNGAELKTQFLFARYDFIAEPISNGWALAANYSSGPGNGRLDIDLTASLFSTDSYDSSISVYESGLRYSFNYISLYGKGGRLSATVRYMFSDSIRLNIKAGGTYYLDRDEISSGQQRIASCHKEDIAVQLIVRF